MEILEACCGDKRYIVSYMNLESLAYCLNDDPSLMINACKLLRFPNPLAFGSQAGTLSSANLLEEAPDLLLR